MTDVFLSYSREDQAIARRFADSLSAEGFIVWWDQALDAGESFDEVTEQALKGAKAVVVLWSKHSVVSRWVRAEATQADRYHTLVPVMIEPCDRPIMFELTHTADLANWKGDAADPRWRAFIEGLRRSIGRDAVPVFSVATLAAPQASRRWTTWGVAVVGLLVIAGLAWHFLGRTSPASATAAASVAAESSIAVLPFDDLSPLKDQQYFADGIAEEILNELARIDSKQLRVIARNSSFAFRGGNQNLKKVGETLGVDNLLEGSVRKSGDQLRITAQLINTQTDAHLWSKTYNRPLTDIFAVQEEIARSVAEALQISLGVGIGGRPGMTRNVAAYEAYLQSGQGGGQVTIDSIRHNIELLQRAVAEDPAFAEAWTRLSGVYGLAAQFDQTSNRKGWQDRSDGATKEALRLQPDLPALLAQLATRSLDARRWNEGMIQLAAYEAATQRYGTPDVLKGTLLMRVGRVREALPLLEGYRARDPLNAGVTQALVRANIDSGNTAAAYSELKRIYGSDVVPPSALGRLSAAQLALDTRDRALLLRVLDENMVVELPQGVKFSATLKEFLDKPKEAVAFLRPTVTPETNNQALIGARWYLAYFGDPEGALEAGRLLYERNAFNFGYTGDIWGPLYRDMRKLPAFKQLMRDIGFVDYWRAHGWGDFCRPVGETDFECN